MENTAVVNCREIVYLAPEKIIPNPYQPRKNFDMISLNELCKSVKKYGIIQPISVRYINNHCFELVAGERRLRAAKLVGIKQVPSIIINITDSESAAISLIENIQRDSLNYFEEAEGYQSLMVDFGYTQERIAEMVGKKQSTIANKMRLLRLNRNIKKILLEENLTERHARALLKVDSIDMQREILMKVIKYGLNVEKTEELIEKAIKKMEDDDILPRSSRVKSYINDIRLFTNTIKSAVNIMQEAGVNTDYNIIHNEEGYEISIKVSL